MEPTAKIIADSVNTLGDRVTTFEVDFHRFILAEFNTHRVFSRNSASSRAIPFSRQLTRMEELGPALPLSWPAEKKGMSGGEELDDHVVRALRQAWLTAAKQAASFGRAFHNGGLHKSVVNRLLEPFMWHKAVVTATAYHNFFDQRVSALAQPEIRAVAEAMYAEYEKGTPTLLKEGQWHLPYIQPDELELPQFELVQISAARCARTSYLTHDGVRSIWEDIKLYQKLITARPAHWSPLEHVATPWVGNRQSDPIGFTHEDNYYRVPVSHLPRVGNLLGWRQLRTTEETLLGERTYR